MGNFEQTKIVLVDNNEQMRTSIKQQMKGEEVKIVADFSDAISALNFIKDNEVDVIITDIVLPNIDGYEFMEAINKQGLANKPKILVLSALSNDNFINKALQLPAKELVKNIAKPLIVYTSLLVPIIIGMLCFQQYSIQRFITNTIVILVGIFVVYKTNCFPESSLLIKKTINRVKNKK